MEKIGTGKSGLGTIKSEIDNNFNYTKGSVGLARTFKNDTEDSQFFIILQDDHYLKASIPLLVRSFLD